jgi:hypothetical protein
MRRFRGDERDPLRQEFEPVPLGRPASRAVCTPTKEPGDGIGESAHRKLSDPVAGRTPLEGDYNLKPRLSRGFFPSRKPMDTLSSAGFLRSGPAHRRSEGPTAESKARCARLIF